MIRLLKKAVKGCWFSFWGHFFALFYYDRKYLTGKWFSGKFGGLCSTGWEWTAKDGFARLLLGTNKGVPFPVSSRINVVEPQNITFHPDDLNNFQTTGNYFQAIGKITIGRGTYIAPNVGIITANHDQADLDAHLPAKPVVLGEKCWIGMNSMILPGVTLGAHTIVGAGAVVTKSFPDGYCVVAGNPAKVLRTISTEDFGKENVNDFGQSAQ